MEKSFLGNFPKGHSVASLGNMDAATSPNGDAGGCDDGRRCQALDRQPQAGAGPRDRPGQDEGSCGQPLAMDLEPGAFEHCPQRHHGYAEGGIGHLAPPLESAKWVPSNSAWQE